MRCFKFKYLVCFVVVASIFYIGHAPQKAFATTYVSGTLNRDTNWESKKSPYIVGEAFVVPKGITLTINPGVIVKFDQVNQAPTILGNIKAMGTKTKPIYFTSLRDDSIGGDTNKDGQSSSPSIYGDWSMIVGDSSILPLSQSGATKNKKDEENDSDHGGNADSNSTFEYVSFRYSQGISITSRTVNITNSSLINSGSGFSLSAGAHLLVNGLDSSNVDRNVLMADGNALIDAQNINLNLEQSSGDAMALFDGATLNISDSSFVKNNAGEAVLSMFGSDATITDSSFQNNQGEGILLFNNSTLSRPSTLKLTGSSFKDMGQEALLLFDGSVATIDNVQLSNLSQAGLGLFDSSATLSNVSFNNGNDVGIELFDSYALPQASSLTADNIVIKNFKAAGILSFDGSVHVKNSTLNSNYEGIEAYVGRRPASDEIFEITNSNISNNDSGINVYSAFDPSDPPYFLQAINNWWGDSSGPFHSTLNAGGTGDTVSDNVNFTPWLTRLCDGSRHKDSCDQEESDHRLGKETDEQKDLDKKHSQSLYERVGQIKNDEESNYRKIQS